MTNDNARILIRPASTRRIPLAIGAVLVGEPRICRIYGIGG